MATEVDAETQASPGLKEQVLGGLRATLALLLITLLIFSVFGFFGSWYWLFDLCAHFRLQYAVIALVLTVIAALAKHPTLTGTGLLCALLNCVPLWGPWWPPPASLPAQGQTTLRLLCHNVYTGNEQKQATVELLRQQNADVMFLMEVDWPWIHALEQDLDAYPHRVLHPRSDNFGAAFFSKWPIQQHWIREFSEVPSIEVLIEVNETTHRLIGTHPLPPVSAEGSNRRDRHLEQLARFLDQDVSNEVIVMGDLNATPFSHAFRHLISQTGLRNAADGFGFHPTWLRENLLFAIPIDHVLLSAGYMVRACAVLDSIGSDHGLVVVDVLMP